MLYRFLPAYKSKHLLNSLTFLGFHHVLVHSTAAICTENNPKYVENNKKEIDFELLFSTCTGIQIARKIHSLLIVSGQMRELKFAARLINVYAHLGNLPSSSTVFKHMQERDTYTWNSMLSIYAQNGQFDEAVDCLYGMLSSTCSDVRPDFYTFPPLLKACRKLADGVRIHCLSSKLGLEWDIFLASSLVHLYCRFGQLVIADRIFKEMPFRDIGCWNSLISGFCQYGNASEALRIVDDMRLEGIEMDAVTVSTILPVCAQKNDSVGGLLIHLYAVKHGLEIDVFVSNALINMYAKFGEIKSAQKVFDQMTIRDLVSWNSIIAAYEQNDFPDHAINFFHEMQLTGEQPDLWTLVSMASSIAQTRCAVSGKAVHGYVLRRFWFSKGVILGNAIVDMFYAHESKKFKGMAAAAMANKMLGGCILMRLWMIDFPPSPTPWSFWNDTAKWR
ncbi:OLC1v1007602C1 [Oldenlandia corymbosa var. corymbosa]|uniref:OLC1v1007602C1 n=1 Tax=Oldenlandia corymbosa var. corymbosa TaxID=529605 RepID=A0AAV1DK20_OLDCO|nr:OLC1v1007602C1 [Oldenlandia corymbosa var. corymbosa]